MTELELEQKIHDYIKTWYSAEYVGKLFVEKDGTFYKLSMAIPSYMTLTSIAGDFNTDEDFLDFIYEELRKRNYMRVDYYKVTRTENSIEEK
jgi:hypothetical protein